MNRKIFVSVIAAAAFAGAHPAFAQGRQLTIEAPGHVDLTMAQAVVIAESMVQGRATRVRLDSRDDRPVYRVTVQSKGASPTKIEVASADGRITARERQDD